MNTQAELTRIRMAMKADGITREEWDRLNGQLISLMARAMSGSRR